MKKNQTRRALLLSDLSLLLCVSMLVGSTFAWFTDSVVSANNIIKSGNLDIEVQYTLDGTTWNDLNGAEDLFQKDLWEPGHVEVVALKIENKGSLALKYTASMNIVDEIVGKNQQGGDIVLSDILTVKTLVQGTGMVGDIVLQLAFDNRDSSLAYETNNAFKAASVLRQDQELMPGDAHIAIVRVEMAETVGNEANHDGVNKPSITFGINVLATQYTYEKDSFGPDYDENATYPTVVYDNEGLNKALDAGEKNVKLAAGTYTFPASKLTADTTLTCEPGTVFEGSASLGINGATVIGATFSNEGKTIANQHTVNGVFENCTFRGRNILSGCYAGETVIFKNCVFDGDVYGVHFDSGANDVTFIDCTFSGFNTFGGALTKLTLDGCTFKALGNSNYNGINMWGDTELIDCTFVFDGTAANEWCDLANDNKTVTFTNCVVTDGTNTQSIKDWNGVGDYGTGNTIIYK